MKINRETYSGEQRCRVYESKVIQAVTGETIRPGGFSLTDRGVNYCGWGEKAKILDIGCGTGATVERLDEYYHLDAVGIDPSSLLISRGQERNPGLKLIEARGESLPFETGTLDGVFAECTLSLMTDLEKTLQEIYRVLKKSGWLVVTDLYARNEEAALAGKDIPLDCCLCGAKPKSYLPNKLANRGLMPMLWEDHTALIKELAVKLIFQYGSLANFWSQTVGGREKAANFQPAVQKAKIGYFLLIAQK